MKKRVRTILLMLLSLSLLWGCRDSSEQEEPNSDNLSISCIDYYPYTYMDGDSLTGWDKEMMDGVFGQLGYTKEIEVADSWATAYEDTLNGTQRVLLTTCYTEERKDLFKWAGPTSYETYYLFTTTESGIRADNLTEARQLESIGVIQDYAITLELEDLGFTNLVYFEDGSEMIEQTMNGEIQAFAYSNIIRPTMEALGFSSGDIWWNFRLKTYFSYLAFSKDVSDEIVERYQNAVNEVIINGTSDGLQNYYCKGHGTPLGLIQIFTEENIPQNFSQDDELKGSAVDIVNEIQSGIGGFINPIRMAIWTDGYDNVQLLPKSALFSVARTEEREPLFQWVGPICSTEACFFVLSDSGITISTMEEAKALESVATVKGWYTDTLLDENGFENKMTANTPSEVFRMLLTGEVKALLLEDITIPWLAEEADVSVDDISTQLSVFQGDNYIAFSLDTPGSTVEQWQNQLDAMKSDGTFETIWEEWYPEMHCPF